MPQHQTAARLEVWWQRRDHHALTGSSSLREIIDARPILLDDKQSGFHVACHALRLFGAEEFKRWLGNDQYLIDPSANALQTVVQSGAREF